MSVVAGERPTKSKLSWKLILGVLLFGLLAIVLVRGLRPVERVRFVVSKETTYLVEPGWNFHASHYGAVWITEA